MTQGEGRRSFGPRAVSIPPSARPSAEHVRALEAAGLMEVRLLKKHAQRPLMSMWKGEDRSKNLVLLTVVDACGTPEERDRVIHSAQALVPLAGTDGLLDVHRVMEAVDAFVTGFLGAGTAADLVVLRWPVLRRVDFACRVSEALVALHESQIVHGCLCPDNILLDDELRPVLSEAGMVSIARSLDGDPENFFGYGAFASPEASRGEPQPRDDIYSVGRLLEFVLLDRTPGGEEDLTELSAKAAPVAAIVRRCLGPTERRYATMGELLAELQRCRQQLVPAEELKERPATEPAPPRAPAPEVKSRPAGDAKSRPVQARSRPAEARSAPARRSFEADDPKSAAPPWIPVLSMVVVAGAVAYAAMVPSRASAVRLAVTALIALGAAGVTTGLRASAGVRLVLALLAFAIAVGVAPVERLSPLDANDALARGAAARSYVAKGGKDLEKAKLQMADLSGLDLTQANLRSADLTAANLQRAKLAGARLEGAALVGAQLEGADLTEVRLDQAYAPEGATCDEATTLPGGWSCGPTHTLRRGDTPKAP